VLVVCAGTTTTGRHVMGYDGRGSVRTLTVTTVGRPVRGNSVSTPILPPNQKTQVNPRKSLKCVELAFAAGNMRFVRVFAAFRESPERTLNH